MKIDTTATILQLSQLLAASAGVAGGVVAAGDVSSPQPAVAAVPSSGQSALSFLQLLTQAQQAGASDAAPVTESDDKPADAPSPADDNSTDPTSISSALLALLSQSNQPLPTNTPVPVTSDASASGKPSEVAAAPVTAGSSAASAPSATLVHGSSNEPPPVTAAGDGKPQPIDIKDAKQPEPVDQATGINITGFEATQSNQDVPPVAAPSAPTVQSPASDPKVITETNPIGDAKPAVPTVDVPQPQQIVQNELTSADVKAPPAPDVTEIVSRHTEIEPIEVKTAEVDNGRPAASPASFNVVGDSSVEVSGDIEPVESSSETVEVDDATHAETLDLNASGESVHGMTELPTAIDPSSQPTTVDAHSLAHHLQEMVTQLSKSDSPDQASVVLRLDPPELGRVNVHMTMTNDVVSIRMVASDDAARQVIERQLNDLQQSLNNQGISFQDCQVQVGGSGQQSSDRGLRKQWVDNSGYSAFTGKRSAITSVSTQVRSANLAQLDYVA